ncbi:MAG: helix-turn-helix transcriptional regulator [Planctomycetes bacterium]|nr:helix-turn-helix transcriptional regulator [Planctomycetota bacterium]
MKAQVYETYWGATALLEEMPAVSWVHINRAHSLGPHRHSGYEIVYVVRGTMDNWIGDRRYRVDAGQVFITPPDSLHGGVDSVLNPNEHCLIHCLIPPEGKALPGLDQATTDALRSDLQAIGATVFRGSPRVKDLIAILMEEHRTPGPYARVVARSALHELLARVVRDANGDRRLRAPRPLPPKVRDAVAWIDAHLSDDISFEALAKRFGHSATHFRRLFLKEVGQTPSDFLMRRRVERAKERFSDARATVTAVALELGFSSSQYFATVFKKYAAMTPKAYRRSLAKSAR